MPESLRQAYLNHYRDQGHELPTEREDIALLNGLSFWVREDPAFVGKILEKMYGSVTEKSQEELYGEYLQLMIYCWDHTSGPERDNMGTNLKEAIDGLRSKM